MTRSYPDPPWETCGNGALCPYLVPARDLSLPDGFQPIHVAGFSTGLLLYVQYVPPSPLSYNELVWMPSLVRCSLGMPAGGRPWRGYYVARMYVDSEASLAGGREIWALPKTLARFVHTADGVQVSADDGTEITLSWHVLGPALPLSGHATTVQHAGVRLVRFRGDFSASLRMSSVRVRSFHSPDPNWDSFRRARRLPLGLRMSTFRATMQPPQER